MWLKAATNSVASPEKYPCATAKVNVRLRLVNPALDQADQTFKKLHAAAKNVVLIRSHEK